MPIVERLKVVELPDLQEKQDVSDWLAAGHSKEELLSIVEAWLSGGRGGTRTPDLLVRSPWVGRPLLPPVSIFQ